MSPETKYYYEVDSLRPVKMRQKMIAQTNSDIKGFSSQVEKVDEL